MSLLLCMRSRFLASHGNLMLIQCCKPSARLLSEPAWDTKFYVMISLSIGHGMHCTICEPHRATVLWMAADFFSVDLPQRPTASKSNSSYTAAPVHVRLLQQMKNVQFSKHETEYLDVYMHGQSVTTQLCKAQICRFPVQQSRLTFDQVISDSYQGGIQH